MDKLRAYSKANLILKVFPQESTESKHKIQSLFCLYKSIYDDVQIEEAKTTTISFKSKNKTLFLDHSKILLAIQYLSKLLKQPIHLKIVICKKIPIMSGLGGSATDVATIIRWLTKKYSLKLSSANLRYIALNIGSDVPFFLSGYASAWVSGYGEKVVKNNKPIPRFKVILSNIRVNTTTVYKAMMENYQSQVNVRQAYQAINKKPFCKSVIYNDMWAFANKINRKLNAFSHKLSKTKNITLTGSGGSFVEIK